MLGHAIEATTPGPVICLGDRFDDMTAVGDMATIQPMAMNLRQSAIGKASLKRHQILQCNSRTIPAKFTM